jgi:hypothetical protein
MASPKMGRIVQRYYHRTVRGLGLILWRTVALLAWAVAVQTVTDGVGALTSGSEGATLKLAGEAGFEPTPWR